MNLVTKGPTPYSSTMVNAGGVLYIYGGLDITTGKQPAELWKYDK